MVADMKKAAAAANARLYFSSKTGGEHSNSLGLPPSLLL